MDCKDTHVRNIRNLYWAKQYDAALSYIDSHVPSSYFTEEIVLLKVVCMLLSEDSSISLKGIRQHLEYAIELRQDSYEAYFELGKFCHIMEDDAVSAQPFFEKARQISENNLTNSIIAIRACQEEIDFKRCVNCCCSEVPLCSSLQDGRCPRNEGTDG